ncbi:hypothetical protein [Streptomyces graminilatus]|uniref:hypothetical protein n=1 Tax=Streptomyces graminilatus TaxID=1464070 RepID=UPI0006E25E65|nr:hypothetical protein [Streptomyces graminilatus]
MSDVLDGPSAVPADGPLHRRTFLAAAGMGALAVAGAAPAARASTGRLTSNSSPSTDIRHGSFADIPTCFPLSPGHGSPDDPDCPRHTITCVSGSRNSHA